MTAVHIDSESRLSGTKYNGIWQFNASIQGQYKIVEQYIDESPIPWIQGSADIIQMAVGFGNFTFNLFYTYINTYNITDDLEAIATFMQAKFTDVGLEQDFTCTVSLNTENDTFELVFNKDVTMRYSAMTGQGIFEYGTVDLTSPNFYWSTKNITLHPHLYAKVNQISSVIIEPDVDKASMIFHTENNPLVGMTFVVNKRVTQFNIAIYRKSLPNDPIQIKNKWDVVFL